MKNYLRYACALLAVPVAILLRFALLPLIGPTTPYITLFPATVIVAVLAGMGPAILTGILSAIAIDYFIISPVYAIEFNVEGISRMTVMILTSIFVGYVGNMLRKAKYKLEERVKKRTAELMKTNEFLRLEESRLDALLQLSQKSEAALDEITGFTLEQAIKLTQSKIGFVGFLSEDEKVYTIHSVSKDVVKECNVAGNPIHWPVDEAGIWADAVRERRTLFVNDYSKPHPRKKGIPAGHVPIEKFMVVPFFDGKRIVTIAGVGNKASNYDKSDERQVSLLLSGMWSCVQKSRSMERLERAYSELEDKVEERTAELAASTAALSVSEVRYRRLFEAAQDGILILDADSGQIIDVNPFIKDMLGYSHEELLNKKVWDIGIFKNIATSKEAFLELQNKGYIRYEDLPLETKDGHKIEVEFISNVYLVNHKKVIQCNIRDITERRRAEENLRASEEQFRRAIVEAPIPVIMHAEDGEVLQISRTWTELTGYRLEDIRSFDEWTTNAVYGEGANAVRDYLHGLFSSSSSSRVDFAVRTKNGDLLFWSFSASAPGTLADGRRFVVGMALDITERVEAEKALRESRKDLDRAQAVAHTGSWRLDVQRNALSWSDEAYKIFGISSGTSLTYETFLECVHPEDRKYVNQKWREAMRGRGYDIEHRIVADGQTKWVRERAELEFEKDGTLLGGFGTVTDITKRKNYEEQIQNLAKFPEENPFPVLRISGDGTIIYSNKPGLVLLEQWERKVEQKIPENWRELVSKSLISGHFIVEEVMCGKRFFSFIIAPVTKGDYVNLYGRDITVVKSAQEALRKSHDKLEKQVGERTKELSKTVSVLQKEAKQRELAEEAVKTERQRLYDVLETLPAYVCLLTPDYRMPFANRVFRESFGYLPDKKCYEFLFNKTEPCEICETYSVLKTNKPHHWQWTGPNGRDYDIFDFPFRDTDGSRLILEMGIDITEQIKAKNEIIENQQALRALAAELQIVEEQERRRIAQDLHDSIGQILSFSGRELKNLQKSVSEKAAKTLQEVANQLDNAVEQTRTLSFNLSPSTLYDLGLEVAIEDLLDRISQKRHIKCQFKSCESAKPLADDVKVLLYRSARELLINAVKHANASSLKVSLSRSNSDIYIKVEDDGRGFDTSILESGSKRAKGFGIFNVRERLNHIGGHMRIESAEGKGTRAILTAPLDIEKE